MRDRDGRCGSVGVARERFGRVLDLRLGGYAVAEALNMSDRRSDVTLPIPDFDHLPLGSVADRIRALDPDQLDQLIAHEQAQGNRLPVLEVMRSRRQQLTEGATPSEGAQDDLHPETGGSEHSSPVDPSSAAQPAPPNRHGLRQVTWGG